MTTSSNTLTRTVPAGLAASRSRPTSGTTSRPTTTTSTPSTRPTAGRRWTQVGQPITGSGTKWASKRWTLQADRRARLTTLFRFRYATDGGVNQAGAFLDNISVKVGQTVVATDGAESGDNGWTVKGWKASTGTEVTNAERYYLLENRQYVGYDTTLAEGPYQFSEAYTRPDWVEHFPFQNGMLVWFVDQGYADNNVSTHPGAGYALPVDAAPELADLPRRHEPEQPS